MDLNLLSVLLAIIALFLSLLLKFLLGKNKSHSSIPSSMLPPGKTGWPILGENLEFLNTGRQGIPEKFIKDRMEKFSSQIFRTSLLGEAVAVMCGPLGNKFLFTNENKLVTLWWPTSVYKIFPSTAQSSSNQESMKMRKILLEFLKTEALQMHVGIMDSIAKRELKDHWDNRKQVTVFPLSKSYTFSLACKLFMSIDDPILIAKFSDPFSVLASGIVSIPIDLPGTRFKKGIKASNLIRKRLREIIKLRKKDLAEGNSSSTQDILSHMLLTGDESGQLMEEYDIADKIVGLLIAGHDTASAAITFVVNYLAELPHVYNEVHKEQMKILNAKAPGDPLNWVDIQKMKYSWKVVCEVMRLAPPIQGTFREALTDFKYNGFSVPKGWKLYWSAYSTHKNPIYFPEPEKFDPSRFEGNGPAPFTYVPFGGGPRMCPGKEYARLEILVFVHNVVTKFKWEKVLRDEKIVVNPLPMPANGLPVRLEPHIY